MRAADLPKSQLGLSPRRPGERSRLRDCEAYGRGPGSPVRFEGCHGANEREWWRTGDRIWFEIFRLMSLRVTSLVCWSSEGGNEGNDQTGETTETKPGGGNNGDKTEGKTTETKPKTKKQ